MTTGKTLSPSESKKRTSFFSRNDDEPSQTNVCVEGRVSTERRARSAHSSADGERQPEAARQGQEGVCRHCSRAFCDTPSELVCCCLLTFWRGRGSQDLIAVVKKRDPRVKAHAEQRQRAADERQVCIVDRRFSFASSKIVCLFGSTRAGAPRRATQAGRRCGSFLMRRAVRAEALVRRQSNGPRRRSSSKRDYTTRRTTRSFAPSLATPTTRPATAATTARRLIASCATRSSSRRVRHARWVDLLVASVHRRLVLARL